MSRTTLFWLHLTAGVTAGSLILVMCVTGTLLTYERNIVAWAERRTVDGAGAERLSLETLTERALTAARGGSSPLGRQDVEVASVTVRSDLHRPVEIGFGAAGMLLMDPYSGAVVGRDAYRTRAFFRAVTEWHRWLARPAGDGRARARSLTGAANLVFLFIVCSGLLLWIPRVWTRANLRSVTWFRRGLRGKARDFNWHNTFGLWSVAPLIVIITSGVVMSYPWANDLLYRAAGQAPPPRTSASAAAAAAPDATRATAPAAFARFDQFVKEAAAADAHWRTISFRVPKPSDRTVAVTVDAGSGGQPQKRTTVTIDTLTGLQMRSEPFATLPPGRRARSWMRFAHTGEAFGVVGQTIAGIASLGGALLVWTGVSMAWRRWRALRRRL